MHQIATQDTSDILCRCSDWQKDTGSLFAMQPLTHANACLALGALCRWLKHRLRRRLQCMLSTATRSKCFELLMLYCVCHVLFVTERGQPHAPRLGIFPRSHMDSSTFSSTLPRWNGGESPQQTSERVYRARSRSLSLHLVLNPDRASIPMCSSGLVVYTKNSRIKAEIRVVVTCNICQDHSCPGLDCCCDSAVLDD